VGESAHYTTESGSRYVSFPFHLAFHPSHLTFPPPFTSSYPIHIPHLVNANAPTGEPPLFMGSCVFFAIRDALKAARAQFGETSVLHLTSPATPERIRVSCADPILKRAWVTPQEGEKSWFVSI
jgi:hypothetical protein